MNWHSAVFLLFWCGIGTFVLSVFVVLIRLMLFRWKPRMGMPALLNRFQWATISLMATATVAKLLDVPLDF